MHLLPFRLCRAIGCSAIYIQNRIFILQLNYVIQLIRHKWAAFICIWFDQNQLDMNEWNDEKKTHTEKQPKQVHLRGHFNALSSQRRLSLFIDEKTTKKKIETTAKPKLFRELTTFAWSPESFIWLFSNEMRFNRQKQISSVQRQFIYLLSESTEWKCAIANLSSGLFSCIFFFGPKTVRKSAFDQHNHSAKICLKCLICGRSIRSGVAVGFAWCYCWYFHSIIIIIITHTERELHTIYLGKNSNANSIRRRKMFENYLRNL